MNRNFLLAIVLVLALASVASSAERRRMVPLEGTVLGSQIGAFEVYGINLIAGLGILPRDICVGWRNGKRLGEYIVVWTGPRYSLIVPRYGNRVALKRGDKISMAGYLSMPRPPPYMPPPGVTVIVKERPTATTMGMPGGGYQFSGGPDFSLPGFSGSTQFSGGPDFSVPTFSGPTFSGSTQFSSSTQFSGGPDFSLPMPAMPGFSLPSVNTATGY